MFSTKDMPRWQKITLVVVALVSWLLIAMGGVGNAIIGMAICTLLFFFAFKIGNAIYRKNKGDTV